MKTNSKTRLSPTMQIAVTVADLNRAAKAAEESQMRADQSERIRKAPLPNYLAAMVR